MLGYQNTRILLAYNDWHRASGKGTLVGIADKLKNGFETSDILNSSYSTLGIYPPLEFFQYSWSSTETKFKYSDLFDEAYHLDYNGYITNCVKLVGAPGTVVMFVCAF